MNGALLDISAIDDSSELQEDWPDLLTKTSAAQLRNLSRGSLRRFSMMDGTTRPDANTSGITVEWL